MFDFSRHGPLLGCVLLAGVAMALPERSTHTPPPPPPDPPTPPVSRPAAEAVMNLGRSAVVKVGLGGGLVPVGVPSSLDVAVEITGQEATGPSRKALVLCLDRSGSMSGGNIRDARDAAASLIRTLGDDDEIAVVSFSSNPVLDVPLMRATDAGKRTALMAVSDLEARGGTNLYGGLELARREARSATAPVRRVVLLSDGIPTEGEVRPNAIMKLSRNMAGDGVVVSTLAVGAQSPGGLMERVATSSGGSYRFLRDGSGLAHALAMELKEAAAVVAQDAVISVHIPTGTRLIRASGAMADQSGDVVQLRLGDVVAHQTRNVLLTLSLPAEQEHTWLIPVRASARESGTPVGAMAEVGAVTSTDATAVARNKVGWVQVRADLADAADEMRRAAEYAEKGDSRTAVEELDRVATKLEAKAKDKPVLVESARKARAFAQGASAAPSASVVANEAHEQAFGFAR
ncbi:MAG: vWA domain-containing protein [Myxococcota bacterium]